MYCANSVDYSNEKDTIAIRVRSIIRNKTAKFIHCEGSSCHTAPSWAKSWLQLWKIACGYDRLAGVICSFEGCASMSFIGAHVRYSGSRERFASWYIVPACVSCNNHRGMAASLKIDTRLLKVVDGRMFKRNKILFGSINEDTASTVLKSIEPGSITGRVLSSVTTWEPATPKPRGQREQIADFVSTVSELRRWPRGAIGWRR